MDYKQEAIKINDELIRSIECTLISLRLFRDVAPPKAYRLIKKQQEALMKKQEEWLATANDEKLKLLKEG
jgi:hypothetical protein